jgi:hypothetical protein
VVVANVHGSKVAITRYCTSQHGLAPHPLSKVSLELMRQLLLLLPQLQQCIVFLRSKLHINLHHHIPSYQSPQLLHVQLYIINFTTLVICLLLTSK